MDALKNDPFLFGAWEVDDVSLTNGRGIIAWRLLKKQTMVSLKIAGFLESRNCLYFFNDFWCPNCCFFSGRTVQNFKLTVKPMWWCKVHGSKIREFETSYVHTTSLCLTSVVRAWLIKGPGTSSAPHMCQRNINMKIDICIHLCVCVYFKKRVETTWHAT